MNDIVFTLEFSDLDANAHANEKLAEGWKLLHVGTINTVDEDVNGNPFLYTIYVVGANQEQYDNYLQEKYALDNFDWEKEIEDIENIVSDNSSHDE